MKIAHILPPPWAGSYPLGDYRMVLAPWALRYPEYAAVMRSSEAYILMDNGAFEGDQLPISKINEAASLVNADEIVLPDVLGEPKETLRLSWKALGKLAIQRVMFVPQGRTYEAWKGCLDAWLTKWWESPWGETYSLSLGVSNLRGAKGTKAQKGTRGELLRYAVSKELPIHLLGVSDMADFTSNELQEAHSLGIRGVDTSSAFAMAAKGKLLTPTTPKVFLGPPDKYEVLPTWARRLALLNMTLLSQWVEAGEASEQIPVYVIRQTASKWLKYWNQGFADLDVVMKACGMPRGRYALLKERRREKSIRPLTRFGKLDENETLVEVKK